MIEPRFRWQLPATADIDPQLLATASGLGLTSRTARLLWSRGLRQPDDLEAFFSTPSAMLHDPALLPDADRFADRILAARAARERVMVYGDFDADGLTGLAILVRALRGLDIEAVPYVPSRLEEGHGLSTAAVAAAQRDGISVIVTVDCGSTSQAEIAVAAGLGIDVLVSDHHRVPADLPPALALVNAHRPDSRYPDRRLSGAGVAFRLAELLLAGGQGGVDRARGLTDLALIGTVADVAPLLGENRAIAMLGLDSIRRTPRAGLAALLERASIAPSSVTPETIAFAIAPRINAPGRVGDVGDALRLLLTDDPQEAAAAAEALEQANLARRELSRQVLEEARGALGGEGAAAVVVRGPWSVGVAGPVAGRLAEETGRPAVVGVDLGSVIRASCRAGEGFHLANALAECDDLLVRHGGHAGAAGFEIEAHRWDDFRTRFVALAERSAPPSVQPSLQVDLVLSAREVDYALLGELGRLEPLGPGNPEPLIAVLGLQVGRVRAANGGHTQLTLRRERDVLDGIAFGRDDLAATLGEGDRVDVVARVMSRTFGGFESLQLEIRDVADAGWHHGVNPDGAVLAAPAGGTDR